jgi:hypothetical protein
MLLHRAETKIGLNVAHGCGKSFGVFVAGAQDVESQTLRAFGADARKLFQLIDQAGHGFGEFRHFQFTFNRLVIFDVAYAIWSAARKCIGPSLRSG